VILGVNSRADLALVEAEARRQILNRHMLAGVTIVDPASTWIEVETEIAEDVRIEPGCSLIGACSIGSGSVIGPHTTLIDSRLGEEVAVPHSYLVECAVGDRCLVGPFAYLRPKAELAEGAKAGTFVEIKNSRIGAGTKVPHLSYIGDADVGEGTNLGAATITANYDGVDKHRTTIGSKVRTSVDTTLVAPVTIGDGAYTGANSAITEDVPPGALAIARPAQRNVEGYADRKADRASEDTGSKEKEAE
jgi:bifunctional UDP-N-acetylglucosamine pyrophosphorylase/glucosamine-1-phosphate N-acetyltransferase